MAFEGKPGPGRPKGSNSIETENFRLTLANYNFNPAIELMRCYKDARRDYKSCIKLRESPPEFDENNPKESKHDMLAHMANLKIAEAKAPVCLAMAIDAAKALASYAFPKLKALELSSEEGIRVIVEDYVTKKPDGT